MRLRRILLGLLCLPLAAFSNAQMISNSSSSALPANLPVIPTTIKNAAFSAVVITEYDRVLNNGNHIHRETKGKVFRDTQGRVRTETEVGNPANGSEQFVRVTILDPVQHTVVHLDPRSKTALVSHMEQSAPSNDQAASTRHGITIGSTPTSGSGQAGAPSIKTQTNNGAAASSAAVKTEPLGTKSIEGVEAVGTKTTRTIAAQVMGNEQPIVSVTDAWYSRDLQILVLNETDDGQSGHNKMKLVDIVRADPNSQLFLIPPDYTVKESAPATASAKP